jgi:hypothetical protein
MIPRPEPGVDCPPLLVVDMLANEWLHPVHKQMNIR